MKNFKKVLSLALAALMVIGGLVVAPVDAKADATSEKHVVIHEVYGGGGNKGALYTDDYIVLYNPTDSEVSLDGWTVQYTSKAGTFTVEEAYATALTGSIGAGEYYIIQEAAGTTVTDKPLPVTADKIGAIFMGAKAGKVALVSNAEAITGVNDADVVDFVAFGSGCNEYEGTGATAAPSNSTSVQRKTLGADTDDNSSDFKVVTPNLSYLTSEDGGDSGNDDEGTTPEATDLDVPANATEKEIVELAYTLADGKKLTKDVTLTGVITVIEDLDTAYNSRHTTIVVDGLTEKPIYCYGMKGEGIENLKVGDTVVVTGQIKNYKGTIEFNLPTFVLEGQDVPTDLDVPAGATQKEIVELAYTLASGKKLTSEVTLTGIITSVDTAYDSSFENVTVTIQVGDLEDKPIQCFRMKGTGADKIGVGDEVTVTGTIKNYNGTVEFDAGCKLDSYKDNEDPTPADIEVPADATDAKILELANTLVPGQSLVGTQTLTGIITSVDTEYSEQYGNVSVTIQIGEDAKSTIIVFRAKGDGADKIGVGDTVTISGKITNYKGKIEFDAGCTIDSYKLSGSIEEKGDMAMPVALILFAGVALVTVGFVNKKKFA